MPKRRSVWSSWNSLAARGDREQHDGSGPLFRAGMAASRLGVSDANLLRLFVSHPLVTLKAISAIHWEALRLWRKGARYHPWPQPPARSVSVGSLQEA
jgi:DUF1365 family protein